MQIKGAGPIYMDGSMDEDGYRLYTVKHLVTGEYGEGPAEAMQTPGLPTPGTEWLFTDPNGGTDADVYAWCKMKMEVKPVQDKLGEPTNLWIVTQWFSTKGDEKRCKTERIEDPLMEPDRISGGFSNYQEEATEDRFGIKTNNSAFEPIRGPINEWEASRNTVVIEQNVPNLELALLTSMKDTLNDAPLWGFERRCIKFKPGPWSYKFHGTCYRYATRQLTFEPRTEGWDREALDEATKVLQGHWNRQGKWELDPVGIDPDSLLDIDPDPTNPSHFMKAIGRDGNPMKVVLNGAGVPYDPDPMDTTTACTGCETAAPTSWKVTLFGLDWVLIHNSGCTWVSDSFEGKLVSLVLAAGTWTLKWVGPAAPDGVTWTATAARFVCLGPSNDLTLDVSPIDAPTTATVFALGSSSPGSIPLQKYGESNFLLLGIPSEID